MTVAMQRNMRRVLRVVPILSLAFLVSACANVGPKTQVGAIGGAAAGGLIGAAAGGGTEGIVGGALLGGLMGGAVGNVLDNEDSN